MSGNVGRVTGNVGKCRKDDGKCREMSGNVGISYGGGPLRVRNVHGGFSGKILVL